MTEEQLEGTERDVDAKGTITFSVRLTQKERERLSRAATVRGWTITNLLKTSALEKAAWILNTSTPTRVDFRSLAVDLAKRLFVLPSVRVPSEQGVVDANLVSNFSPEELPPDWGPEAQLDPMPYGTEELDQFERAVRFGGAEFVNMVLDAGMSIMAPRRTDLPDPIDPNGA